MGFSKSCSHLEASFPQMNRKLCLRAHLWPTSGPYQAIIYSDVLCTAWPKSWPRIPKQSLQCTLGFPLRQGFLLPAVLSLLTLLMPRSTPLNPPSHNLTHGENVGNFMLLNSVMVSPGWNCPSPNPLWGAERRVLLSLHRKMSPMSKVISGVTAIQWDQVMGSYHLGKAGNR